MNPTLKPHIESNTEAVAYLHAGNTHAAMALLKATLQRVRLQQASSWKPGSSSFRTRSQAVASPADARHSGVLQPSTIRSVPIRCAKARDNHFSFYCKAFTIEETCDMQADINTLVFVLLYNLAIAMHTLCVDGKRPGLVQTVLHQYRHALMVLDECCDTQAQNMLAIAQMAAVNNVGFIFSQHQYVAQSQEAMQWMQALVNARWNTIPEEDDAFFTLSLCMDLASFAGAPAA